MKINPLFAQASALNSSNALLVKSDVDFAGKLTLGQIIKGRVLRAYEGGRYLMDFYGQEKVVDSAVPLRPGDVIHGRVVGLGEHVELQRVLPESSARGPQDTSETVDAGHPPLLENKWQRLVTEMFGRYRGTLSAEDAAILERLAARADAAADVVLSGLILSKLGLSIAPEFVQALLSAFQSVSREGAFPLLKSGVRFDVSAAQTEREPVAIEALASVLQQLMSDLPEADWRQSASLPVSEPRTRAASSSASRNEAGGGESAGRGNAELSLARWILNAQAGGSLAHRTLTVPLLVDGRLVELDIALFEQTAGRDGRGDASPLKHRQVVLSLHTEELGRIDVQAALAGDRVRVNVHCDRAEAADFLSMHSTGLALEMEALGLGVDELRYAVRENQAANVVLRSVAEHLVSPGSVSRLL